MNEENKRSGDDSPATMSAYLDSLAGRYVRIDVANRPSECGDLVAHSDYVSFKDRDGAIAKAHVACVQVLPNDPLTLLTSVLNEPRPGRGNAHDAVALGELRKAYLDVVQQTGWKPDGRDGKDSDTIKLRDEPGVRFSISDGPSIVRTGSNGVPVEGIRFDPALGRYVGKDGTPARVVVTEMVVKALRGEPE